LSSIGLNLDKLREQGGIAVQPGKPYLADFEKENSSPFTTTSGKVELYSNALEKDKFDPLPKYEPTPEPTAGFFRLLYGRAPVHTFGRTQNTPLLNEMMSENEVWVNDEAATSMGLVHGARVMLENQDGVKSGPLKVKATPRIRKDCVFIVHGFGHEAPGLTRANRKGASDTALQTKYKLDPISGGAGLRINFVKLVPAGSA
jgi:thiosulfate reductase/polysulfide reductase chain A